MSYYLDMYKDKFPEQVKYISENITKHRCIICGNPILKNPEFGFYCPVCEKNLCIEETYPGGVASGDEYKAVFEALVKKTIADNYAAERIISHHRAIELLRECLTSIDEHSEEFDVKVNAIMSTGIKNEELKALGFDYMVAFIEDYLEKQNEEV